LIRVAFKAVWEITGGLETLPWVAVRLAEAAAGREWGTEERHAPATIKEPAAVNKPATSIQTRAKDSSNFN
jgi:hypothetical protein